MNFIHDLSLDIDLLGFLYYRFILVNSLVTIVGIHGRKKLSKFIWYALKLCKFNSVKMKLELITRGL